VLLWEASNHGITQSAVSFEALSESSATKEDEEMKTNFERGKAVEEFALDYVLELGVACHSANGIDIHAHDLETGSLKIEVKGSGYGRINHDTKGYQFIRKRSTSSRVVLSDLTLLFCFDTLDTDNLVDVFRGVFVIPSLGISSHRISIVARDPVKYVGKFKDFFNRTDLILAGEK